MGKKASTTNLLFNCTHSDFALKEKNMIPAFSSGLDFSVNIFRYKIIHVFLFSPSSKQIEMQYKDGFHPKLSEKLFSSVKINLEKLQHE